MTADWTPKPGDKVQVPAGLTRPGSQVRTWWWAEVRTVEPPYVRVAITKRGKTTLATYLLSQIHPDNAVRK